METRAAIATKAGAPLSIETVTLDGPKEGEVLVEIKATGVCHTDAFTLSGDDPEGIFPAILGHEGAGVVVDCGPGVTTLKKGDHVIPLYIPECRQCKSCLSGKTNLVAVRRCAPAGRGGAAGNKFRVGVGMPTSGVMNCADNSGKLPLRAWASGQGGPKGMLRPGAGGARRCGVPLPFPAWPGLNGVAVLRFHRREEPVHHGGCWCQGPLE